MDDLVAVAAYAIILIIFGVVSLIKKFQAEQKRREVLAKQRAQARPQKRVASSGGMRPGETPAKTIESQRPEIEEEIPEPAVESEPRLDMDEVLRRAMGYPVRKTPPVVRKLVQKKVSRPQPVQPVKEKISLPQLEPSQVKAQPILSTHLGWNDFVDELKSHELSDLQRAIVFTEVFSPPLALRRGNQFWKRGRLFG